jgi:hypothetical protein
MKHEIVKLFRNPLWRLENLYKIIDKKAKKHLLKLNPVQREIAEAGRKAKRMAVLKARQFGVTTLGVIQKLDTAIWNTNRTCVILAHKRDVLDKIFNIARVAYDSMPEDLKPVLDRGGGSRYELRFPEINSVIYTTLEVRGGTIHELHISESAFIERSRIDATLQAVPIDGKVTYETTPNGLNHFHDTWNDLENGIEKLFFPWFFNPEYRIATQPLKLTENEELLVVQAAERYGIVLTHEQIAFRRFKIKELNNSFEKFISEYPEDDQSCFLSSGTNPFDLFELKRQILLLPDSERFESENGIRICKRPDIKKNYIIAADVAEGVRSDYSHADVYCVEDREQVAQFRSNTHSPGQFADVLQQMGKLYSKSSKWPLMIIERNNHGHAVLLKLEETHRYPNLWEDDDERPGHRTTSLSRPVMLDQFIEAIKENYLKINFRQTYAECLTLVDNNGKIEADTGKNDDAVISAALGLKAMLKASAKIELLNNISKKIRV